MGTGNRSKQKERTAQARPPRFLCHGKQQRYVSEQDKRGDGQRRGKERGRGRSRTETRNLLFNSGQQARYGLEPNPRQTHGRVPPLALKSVPKQIVNIVGENEQPAGCLGVERVLEGGKRKKKKRKTSEGAELMKKQLKHTYQHMRPIHKQIRGNALPCFVFKNRQNPERDRRLTQDLCLYRPKRCVISRAFYSAGGGG